MSKIQSESNSQLCKPHGSEDRRCGSNVKDTIWKQFTTAGYRVIRVQQLWFQCQRYNLKAIHNFPVSFMYSGAVVVPMSKIQSESNSQHSANGEYLIPRCGSNVKDTIWKQFTTFTVADFPYSMLWFQCQRYNLKAIHNCSRRRLWIWGVVVPMSKIQSESNSQHIACNDFRDISCGSNVKDTIWKQFTTPVFLSHPQGQLWFQCQRYNLKAIHNEWREASLLLHVVVPMSKIQSADFKIIM